MKIAGAISGTSLDGIDVALCEVRASGEGLRARCERFATVPFDDALRNRILAAYPPAPVGALELSALHAAIGEAFGEAIRAVAGDGALDAVASHGVTLAHDGDARHTLQLGDAFRIRERVDATVVYDFRSADTAAGGSGAPLVPFVDALLFGEHAPCVALNLGGIANMTVLPDGIAFDSGPANLPIDTYVALRTNGAQRFDAGGALARAGAVDEALLERLLDDPYLRRPPPKTTGREQFGAPFVAQRRAALDALRFEDAVATLTAFTARTVADAFAAAAPRARLLIVSGGGARNAALLGMLRERLPDVRVAALGRLRHRCRREGGDRLRRARIRRAAGARRGDAAGDRRGGPARPGRVRAAPSARSLRAARERSELGACVGRREGGPGDLRRGRCRRFVDRRGGFSRRRARARGARARRANATTIGIDDAADAIVATIRRALERERPEAIHVGAAGAGRRRIADGLRELLELAFPRARIAVGGDAAIAFRAAIPAGDGAVLVAGTGSTAFAQRGETSARVGGLGFLAGDEGSAFWIGMQAVMLYGRVLDGRARRDETTDLVARSLDANDRDGYLAALYDAPLQPAAIAALAPSVIAFAGKGNRASTKIVQQAAQELGELVKAALRETELLQASPPVAFAGGLLRENSLLTFLLETRLQGDVPGIGIVKGGDEPVRGALRLAELAAR